MKHPISDKAEVSIDFPEKFYMGSFGHESSLDVAADREGIHINLERSGEQKRRVGFHVHYYLLADLLKSIGEALPGRGEMDEAQRRALERAAHGLARAVERRRPKPRHKSSPRA